MNDVVAWSGGFDSTYLIKYLIETGLLSNREITLVSFHHNLCNEDKNIREEKRRKLILGHLKDIYRSIKFNYIEINTQVNYEVTKNVDTNDSSGLSQPIIWLSQIIPIIPSNSNIYFGYIINDKAIGIINNMQNIIKEACFIQGKHNINLQTPLAINKTKLDIMNYFIENNQTLLKLCTSCEGDGDKDKCGHCEPCCHMKSALLELFVNGNEKAGELLNEWYGIKCNLVFEDNKEQLKSKRNT